MRTYTTPILSKLYIIRFRTNATATLQNLHRSHEIKSLNITHHSIHKKQGWESLGTSRFDFDYEVNDSILKRLSMHLDATNFVMYISMRDFQKYVYTSGFATQSLLITSSFCDDH